MASVTGYYYAAHSAKRTKAVMDLHDDGSVSLRAENHTQTFGPGAVEVSRGLGRIARRFTFSDGAVFEGDDDPAVDSWLEGQGRHRFNQMLRLLESRWKWVAAALAIFIVFVALFIQFGMPVSARLLAGVVPEATRVTIGNQTERMINPLLGTSFRPEGPEYVMLREYFTRLQASADVNLVTVLEFRDGGEIGENAVALPNGKVVVTRELVELADDPVAVAGVIAHEIGHVHHRHGLQRAIQASMLPAVLAWITGDLGTSATFLGALATGLVENSYSRSQEHEADVFAADLMAKEGLSTTPLAGLLERLVEKHGEMPSALSTHPATMDRVAFFRGELGP